MMKFNKVLRDKEGGNFLLGAPYFLRGCTTEGLIEWGLTPLSAVFQLYRGGLKDRKLAQINISYLITSVRTL
jgi:hypothetical protein